MEQLVTVGGVSDDLHAGGADEEIAGLALDAGGAARGDVAVGERRGDGLAGVGARVEVVAGEALRAGGVAAVRGARGDIEREVVDAFVFLENFGVNAPGTDTIARVDGTAGDGRSLEAGPVAQQNVARIADETPCGGGEAGAVVLGGTVGQDWLAGG